MYYPQQLQSTKITLHQTEFTLRSALSKQKNYISPDQLFKNSIDIQPLKFASWVPEFLKKEVEFNFMHDKEFKSNNRSKHQESSSKVQKCLAESFGASSSGSSQESSSGLNMARNESGKFLVESLGCSSESCVEEENEETIQERNVNPDSGSLAKVKFIAKEDFLNKKKIAEFEREMKIQKILFDLKDELERFSNLSLKQEFLQDLEFKIEKIFSFKMKGDCEMMINLREILFAGVKDGDRVFLYYKSYQMLCRVFRG